MHERIDPSHNFDRSQVLGFEIKPRDLDHDRYFWGRLRASLDRLSKADPDSVLRIIVDDSLWGRTMYSPHYLAGLAVDRWAIRAGLSIGRRWDSDNRVLSVIVQW